MEKQSLGLIETVGYVPAVEAADAGAKAANVDMIGYGNVDAGLITIKFRGDVGAVKAAVKAAAAAAQRVGKVVSVHVIPRPDLQLNIGPPREGPPSVEKGSPGGGSPAPSVPPSDETETAETATTEEKTGEETSGLTPTMTAEPEGQPPAAAVEEMGKKPARKKSGGRKKKG